MFSDNSKISIRQTYRLFLFDFLGLASLILPSYLAAVAGRFGFLCIIIGTVFSLGFLGLIGYVQSHVDSASGAILKRIINIVVAIHSMLAAAFCLDVFVDLVRYSLVPDEHYWVVLSVIILVSLYAIKGGLESRARVYEVLFWFVLIPLIIMLVGAFFYINWSRLDVTNLRETYGVVTEKASLKRICVGIIKGSYAVFSSSTTLIYVLFIKRNVNKKKQRFFHRAIAKALLLSGIILLSIYIILLGNFGVLSLRNMSFPVVTLMSTVQITGSFFKRTDALMMSIWFFTMFAIVNIHLFYACRLLYEGLFPKTMLSDDGKKQNGTSINYKKEIVNWSVVIVIFIIALLFHGQEEILSKYLNVFLYVIIPILILVPVVMLLSGCNSNELENRCFPMMAAVDYDENKNKIEFFYTFPKTGINSDSGQETANVSIMPVYDTSFGSAKQTYEDDLSLEADLNHLKVIILGEDFVGREEDFDMMIDTLNSDESFPRNTYVVVVDKADIFWELNDTMSNDIGSYIETLLEKKEENEGLKLVTIGDLMNQDTDVKKNIPFLNMIEIPGNN